MARSFLRLGTALALAASLSMAASPALARDRWHNGRHHDRGIDAGDVLAGVLIIGGIAAIASAASKPKEPKVVYREPYPDTRPEYRPEYAPRPVASPSYVGGGIDTAVDMCVDQVERGDERVASVDNATRTNDGWRIAGQLGAGGGFSCWIDNDGRIRNVDLGGDYYGASYDEPSRGQLDDETYAEARARLRAPDAQAGDDDYAEIDSDLAASDY
jgi:hypothetical protein